MATTVEKCLELDVGTATDIATDESGAGTFTWTREGDGEEVATIGYHYLPTDDVFRLHYTVDGAFRDEPEEISYAVELTYTPANFGGERPWFRCPECQSRRAKLHKPPRRERFLCRDCHGLLYESQTYTSTMIQPFDRMDQVQNRINREGLSREALREFYEAKKDVFRAMNDRCREHGHGDLAEFPYPDTFEAWFQELLEDIYGPHFGEHGRCEATAKSTGERCWQPATGEHGKCYYHGGAEGSGAPEGNQNAVSHGAYSERLLETLSEREQEAMEEAAGRLADVDGAEEI